VPGVALVGRDGAFGVGLGNVGELVEVEVFEAGSGLREGGEGGLEGGADGGVEAFEDVALQDAETELRDGFGGEGAWGLAGEDGVEQGAAGDGGG